MVHFTSLSGAVPYCSEVTLSLETLTGRNPDVAMCFNSFCICQLTHNFSLSWSQSSFTSDYMLMCPFTSLRHDCQLSRYARRLAKGEWVRGQININTLCVLGIFTARTLIQFITLDLPENVFCLAHLDPWVDLLNWLIYCQLSLNTEDCGFERNIAADIQKLS